MLPAGLPVHHAPRATVEFAWWRGTSLVPPRRTSFAAAFATGRTPSAGFTLIELLIVVAIIATLTGIAVPLYRGMTEGSKLAKAIADITILDAEIGMFEFTNRRLPVDLAEMGRAALKDPWDNPYEYLNFAAARGTRRCARTTLCTP